MFARIEGSLGAVTQSQFGENIRNMIFNRSLRDHQVTSDLFIAGPFFNQS